MTDLLSLAAINWPTRVFLEDLSSSLRFAEAEDMVTRRAEELGNRTGEQLLVRPGFDVGSVIDLLAILRCGATAVVVSRQLSDQTVGRQIEQAAGDRRQCHSILFTSGTSSGPKGARFSSANWEAAAAASMASLGHGPGDRWLCPLPLHHVGGLSIILRSLAAGGHVILAPDLEQASRWLDRVQFASVVPTQLHRILLRRSDAFSTAPRVLVGGGPVDQGLLDKAATAGLTVLPTYGMTETTSQVATARPGDPQRRLFPLHGIEIRIGAEQQIEVKGPTVFLGYVGEPERSRDDWLSTSDRGRIEPDGSLMVLGRLDRMIISGGEKIDPGEVEAAIASHPGVDEVSVLGLPDVEWGEVVAAAYVGYVEPGKLQTFLRARVRPSAIPKRWLRLERLPRTDLDKIDVAELASLFHA
jgi:O-succinylbenzoic acid--CoA ligase